MLLSNNKMALGIFSLLEASILLLNALAILNPHYLLKKYSMDSPEKVQDMDIVKKQLTFLLYAARTYGRSK